ncbi:hypothetical protein Efla_007761 [Eimeria flavescens]
MLMTSCVAPRCESHGIRLKVCLERTDALGMVLRDLTTLTISLLDIALAIDFRQEVNLYSVIIQEVGDGLVAREDDDTFHASKEVDLIVKGKRPRSATAVCAEQPGPDTLQTILRFSADIARFNGVGALLSGGGLAYVMLLDMWDTVVVAEFWHWPIRMIGQC